MDPSRHAIWIDLDNSPHVPLFAPLIRHYRGRGVEVILTARDHSQTLELLKLAGIDGEVTAIGRHYGKSKVNKLGGLLVRARQLVTHIKRRPDNGNKRIAVAVSHGSRSMVLAARWLKIPALTMYDYEFTETAIFNRLSTRVVVPDGVPNAVLDALSLPEEKRVKYPGIKEELYVRTFQPDEGFRNNFFRHHGIEDLPDTVMAVLRPPATTANYHSAASEGVLGAILEKLLSEPRVLTVIVPRTSAQAAELRKTIGNIHPSTSNYLILDDAVDGLDLTYAADLVISGGGTMNREAVLLGVPVYSIFAGRQGALDAAMEREGMMTFVRTAADIDKIALEKRDRGHDALTSNRLTDRVERFVIEQIDSFLL